MPTLELEAWPPVGATYSHWTDLLLATQLSALRRGYGSIVPVWGGAQSKALKIKIGFRSTWAHPPRRELLLVAAQRDQQDSVGSWTVTEKPSEKEGTPTELQKPHLEKLEAGTHVLSPSKLDWIEGALRATARNDGRFLMAIEPQADLPLGVWARTFALTCVLQPSQCDFHVHFTETRKGEWRCVEIKGAHSCVPTGTSTATQDLVSRMGTFAPVKLQDSVCVHRWSEKPNARALSVVEKQLGGFPVEAPSDDDDVSDAPPVVEPSSDSDSDSDSNNDSSSSSSSDAWRSAAVRHAGLHRSLVDTCAAAFDAETDLAQATSWLERCTEDARAAQGRLESQRKLVEAHRRRAEKERLRLQHQVEREQCRTEKAEEKKRKKVSGAKAAGK